MLSKVEIEVEGSRSSFCPPLVGKRTQTATVTVFICFLYQIYVVHVVVKHHFQMNFTLGQK
jgi:hypothetical protein